MSQCIEINIIINLSECWEALGAWELDGSFAHRNATGLLKTWLGGEGLSSCPQDGVLVYGPSRWT